MTVVIHLRTVGGAKEQLNDQSLERYFNFLSCSYNIRPVGGAAAPSAALLL